MLRCEKRLLSCYPSIIALFVKGLGQRTLINVDSKLMSDLIQRFQPLLLRGCSVSNKTLAERWAATSLVRSNWLLSTATYSLIWNLKVWSNLSTRPKSVVA
jgi:hypothetical protein